MLLFRVFHRLPFIIFHPDEDDSLFLYIFASSMKTTLTLQQALGKIKGGHLGQLKGLDVNDITYVLDGAKEIVLLTYCQKDAASPAAVIDEHASEISQYTGGAKGALLQLVTGCDYELSMDDMLCIEKVKGLLAEHTEFSWDVDRDESSTFPLRFDLYISQL